MTDLTELIEQTEREAFVKWTMAPAQAGKYRLTTRGGTYRHVITRTAWEAWKARAAHQRPCRGVVHPGCDYLAACGSICNKCGQRV